MNSRFLKGWIKFPKTTPNNFGETKPITFDQEFNFIDTSYSYKNKARVWRGQSSRQFKI